MEIRVLKYFLAVAREENITRAAQLLHVTQPTLSRQIMQMEEELGVKLFTRSKHNIVLTEDGMLLKRRAQELIALADKTKRDFIREEEKLSGEITIGSGEFRSTRIFSQIMAAFQEKHPLVSYRIYSGNADNIKDQIERGLLDIGVMGGPTDIQKYNFVPMPVKERWGVLTRLDSGLAEKEKITPEDLEGIPLITTSREYVQNDLANWLGGAYGQMHIAASGNLLYNEAMMAESGIGTVICIKLDCIYENLRFIPLYPPVETVTALVWKKDQVFSPTTAAFIEYASQYLKGISNDKI
ncbi:LysR family transcriptional regulator [Christensenella tenuis]|uniref:LysR family transcriptional regulator n=1 Tax=Christensenella tenuis TaxID=2763033 RepID=A0ABR7EF06_9FIRM|nr:LysR family transcriptional regulator [Christensenella tenuis]MBC5647704.1 LysR family transcriptional regulator [Christensenella tenuis]